MTRDLEEDAEKLMKATVLYLGLKMEIAYGTDLE